MDILFFTRGRGRGHAVRDLEIRNSLNTLDPSIETAHAPYGVGFKVLSDKGIEVHNLLLNHSSSFSDLSLRCLSLIKRLRPRLVVAQEEPAALLAAAGENIPSLYSTYWFSRSNLYKYKAVRLANRLLFMENEGLLPIPQGLADRIVYCGPVLRQMQIDYRSVARFRNGLGIGDDTVLISVLPGSRSETEEPLYRLVLAAFSQLQCKSKWLIWVAGEDYELLSDQEKPVNISVLENTAEIDSLILASQLVITKGTYNISREIAALGKPCISISHHRNWVDDFYAAQWPSNIPLSYADTRPEGLAKRIELSLQPRLTFDMDTELLAGSGARCAALTCLQMLNDASTN